MQKPTRLTAMQQNRQQTTGSLARLATQKRRVTAQLEAQETELLPTVNRSFVMDSATLYKAQDTTALMLIAGAVEDFYRQVGRLPRELTVNAVTLLEYALAVGDSRFYYARVGAVRRPVRLLSTVGMDSDTVMCHG